MKTVFVLLCVSFAQFLFGKTIEVCPTCPVSSIKQAIQMAHACDTIFIKKGTYTEGNILIDKELTLIGEDYPVLDGQNNTEIITITSDFVNIIGLQIQNVGTSYTQDRAGIRLKKVHHFHIKDNRLFNSFFGVYLENSSDGIVEGNMVKGKATNETSSGNAIHMWYCNNVLIINNYVSGHRDGIYFEFVDHSTITGNLSEDNLRYGLHFMFSNDDTYRRNTFRNNGAGVAVMYSRHIGMFQNIFERNWGAAAYGLLLKEIHDSEINGNTFRENTVGIFAETSNRMNCHGNEFTQNGWAIKISGGCQQSRVEGNNFFNNTFDLATQMAAADDSYNGNFWSDYNGYDLDHDGRGDVPHRPMKLFSYVVGKTPEAMVLLRSLFVDILNFSEKVSPVFTPENVVDKRPSMKPFPLKGARQFANRLPFTASIGGAVDEAK
ncbi:MAG: nitrous oxide reductase family maturation protein NosD [Bacteroidetes bacterium]|nr:nitrous oxide reductase family maturation protein NosD [Bacteroidota bacterium]